MLSVLSLFSYNACQNWQAFVASLVTAWNANPLVKVWLLDEVGWGSIFSLVSILVQTHWYMSCLGLHSTCGSRDNLLVVRQTHDRKVASLNPGRSCGRIFFFRVNFVCWLVFGVSGSLAWLQRHLKGPGHSAKGRLHLIMRTPLTQRSWSGLTMPLFRHSIGTYREINSSATCQGTWPQLSQLAEPLWTDPGLKSGISVCKLISTWKRKCAGGEWMVKHSPQILTSQAIASTTTTKIRSTVCWHRAQWSVAWKRMYCVTVAEYSKWWLWLLPWEEDHYCLKMTVKCVVAVRHWDVSVTNRKSLVDPFVWLTSKITQPPSESSGFIHSSFARWTL